MFWLVATAFAQTPILYDREDPAAALAFVVDKTGLPADQLSPLPLDAVLGTAPATLGGAAMRRCSGAASGGAAVAAELARAEAAWAAADRAGTADHLDLAVAQIGCLQELVDLGTAARVFLLRGALQLDQGAADAARSELATAISLAPALRWEDGLPDAGIGLLEEVRTAPAVHTLSVVPPTAPSGPWIDGVVVGGSRQVSAGLHLLQTSDIKGIRSAWLVLEGDATLVVPGSFRRPVLESMGDPDGQARVAALMAATAPSLTRFTAGYVVSGGGLWLVADEDGGPRVTQLAAPPPAVVEPTGKEEKKRKEKKGRG